MSQNNMVGNHSYQQKDHSTTPIQIPGRRRLFSNGDSIGSSDDMTDEMTGISPCKHNVRFEHYSRDTIQEGEMFSLEEMRQTIHSEDIHDHSLSSSMTDHSSPWKTRPSRLNHFPPHDHSISLVPSPICEGVPHHHYQSSGSLQHQYTNGCFLYSPMHRERTLTNQTLISFQQSPSTSSINSSYRSRTRSDPSAPPFSHVFDMLPGYEENTGFSTVHIHPPNTPPYSPTYLSGAGEPPPPYSPCADQRDFCDDSEVPERIINGNVTSQDSTITEEDALDALTKFVTKTCCYSSSIAKHIKTKRITPFNGQQYVLETFYEERSTSWHQEPYVNQTIDGPRNGQPPKAWDIPVPVPKMFMEKEKHVEVPHTASIRECSRCLAKGRTACEPCKGSGNLKCVVCDGLGFFHHSYHADMQGLDKSSSTTDQRHCHHCNGGRRKCHNCTGIGDVVCVTCQGNARVKTYIRLTVKWKVMKSNKVIEDTELPIKYVSEASGVLVYHDQNDRIFPLVDYPDQRVNAISRKLVHTHKEDLNQVKIIMQRHYVREVPICEVRSQWKRRDFTYWVYGNENNVYCPEYPAKCYPACTLL